MFESDEGDYYKPIEIGNAFSNSWMLMLNMKVMGIKSLSIKEYLDTIKPHLNDLIDDHKT